MGDGDNQYKKYKGFKILRGDESNPTFGILVDDVSEAMHICDPDDQNTDWNVSAYSHPTVVIHSATTPATDYLIMYHDATNGYMTVTGGNLVMSGITNVQLAVSGTSKVTLTTTALTITGPGFTMGATGAPAGDFILWATQTSAKIWLDVDADTNGAFYFGANDYGIDVGFYGQTIANSMIWDASANALTFTAGGITMGVTSKMVLPVKASGSATAGDIWVDTTDNVLHFYAGANEYIVTATAV